MTQRNVQRESSMTRKKMTVVVVDDESLARELLCLSLKDHPYLEVVAECKNGREAIEATQQHKPDIMFLDIQMPGMNGFEVIKALKPEIIPHIVFVTAFDDYAVDAFDANAIDYVLKPISDERLGRAIERVYEYHNSQAHSRPALQAAVSAVADRVREKEKLRAVSVPEVAPVEVRKLSIKDGDTVSIVNEADIDWVDAAGDYMCIHVDGVTHVMRSTLHELLGRLSEKHFKRVHRSTIVNINRIMRVQKHTKGEYFLYLKGDEKIKVSRHYKGVIKEFIDQKQ